jgi:hypothetical protein
VFLKRNGSQGDHSTPIVGRTHNSQAGRQARPKAHFHGIGAVISPQRGVIRGLIRGFRSQQNCWVTSNTWSGPLVQPFRVEVPILKTSHPFFIPAICRVARSKPSNSFINSDDRPRARVNPSVAFICRLTWCLDIYFFRSDPCVQFSRIVRSWCQSQEIFQYLFARQV